MEGCADTHSDTAEVVETVFTVFPVVGWVVYGVEDVVLGCVVGVGVMVSVRAS